MSVIHGNTAQIHGGGIYILQIQSHVRKRSWELSAYTFHGGKDHRKRQTSAMTGNGGGIACEDDSGNLGADAIRCSYAALLSSPTKRPPNMAAASPSSRNCSNARMHFNLIGVNGAGNPAGNSAPNAKRWRNLHRRHANRSIGDKRVTAAIPFIPISRPASEYHCGQHRPKRRRDRTWRTARPRLYSAITSATPRTPNLANTATRMGGGIYSTGRRATNWSHHSAAFQILALHGWRQLYRRQHRASWRWRCIRKWVGR